MFEKFSGRETFCLRSASLGSNYTVLENSKITVSSVRLSAVIEAKKSAIVENISIFPRLVWTAVQNVSGGTTAVTVRPSRNVGVRRAIQINLEFLSTVTVTHLTRLLYAGEGYAVLESSRCRAIIEELAPIPPLLLSPPATPKPIRLNKKRAVIAANHIFKAEAKAYKEAAKRGDCFWNICDLICNFSKTIYDHINAKLA